VCEFIYQLSFLRLHFCLTYNCRVALQLYGFVLRAQVLLVCLECSLFRDVFAYVFGPGLHRHFLRQAQRLRHDFKRFQAVCE
jgi:hypothetical protein